MILSVWYLILILDGSGRALEVVPMVSAQACETAKARYLATVDNDLAASAVCVASGAK